MTTFSDQFLKIESASEKEFCAFFNFWKISWGFCTSVTGTQFNCVDSGCRWAKHNTCSLLLKLSCRAGWSDSKFPCGHLTPVHSALPLCFEWSIIYWGYKCESCCSLSFAHQTDPTPEIFSVVVLCSLAGSPQTVLHIYWLTVAGSRYQETSLSPSWELQISFYDTKQVLEILAKIWLIRDCKFRYIMLHVWLVCLGVCEQVRMCHCLLVVEIWASYCSDMFVLLGCDTVQFDRHVSGL